MILVDANILMYAAGVEHPHKAPSLQLLTRIAGGDVHAALDAEVLQEVLHRYRALKRWDDGRRVYDAARSVFAVVLPVTVAVVDRARALLDEYPRAVARDALHAAVVHEHGLDGIYSYDRDFDTLGVARWEP